jgi:hypothetical protein
MDVDELTTDVLLHYGKKGMKWGERRAAGRANSTQTSSHGGGNNARQEITVTQKGAHALKTKGGKYGAASEDARRAAAGRQSIKKSGVHSLSNKELQEVVTRMNLEQQYVRLSTPQKKQGKSFVDEAITNVPKLIGAAKQAQGKKAS